MWCAFTGACENCRTIDTTVGIALPPNQTKKKRKNKQKQMKGKKQEHRTETAHALVTAVGWKEFAASCRVVQQAVASLRGGGCTRGRCAGCDGSGCLGRGGYRGNTWTRVAVDRTSVGNVGNVARFNDVTQLARSWAVGGIQIAVALFRCGGGSWRRCGSVNALIFVGKVATIKRLVTHKRGFDALLAIFACKFTIIAGYIRSELAFESLRVVMRIVIAAKTQWGGGAPDWIFGCGKWTLTA
jgi:hypothetical protein